MRITLYGKKRVKVVERFDHSVLIVYWDNQDMEPKSVNPALLKRVTVGKTPKNKTNKQTKLRL